MPGQRLRFNYGEILSILSSMTANRQVVAPAGADPAASVAAGSSKLPASFIMQELPGVQDAIENAPVIPDQGRPQTDGGTGSVGMAR